MEIQIADLDPEDEDDKNTIELLRADFEQKEWPELTLAPYKSDEKRYAFCCDTLGEDTILLDE